MGRDPRTSDNSTDRNGGRDPELNFNNTYGGREFPDIPRGAKETSADTQGGKYGSQRSGQTYDGPHVGPAGGSGEGKTFGIKGGYSGKRGGVNRVGSMHGHPHLDGRKNGR